MATPGAHCAATPKSASRRSSRRSWFDTPPATARDIAVENQPLKTMNSRSKLRSIEDVETLVLSHFTKPPRISFGKIMVGRSKTRVLLIQNPADYEQEVVVERFPYKKGFNVDQTHLVLDPEEVVTLTLTWTPQDAGGCREMVLFHINDVYRLQAYMFGTADDPKPVKKRKGMLGTRRKQQPTSIVETKSLKSIRDNYSPRRSEEVRELHCHIKNQHPLQADQENIHPAECVAPHTPPPLESTAICKSDEKGDVDMVVERRKSGFISPTLSKMSPIPLTADNDNGYTLESYFSNTAGHHTPTLGDRDMDRSPLKCVTGSENRMSNSSNKSSKSKERLSETYKSKKIMGQENCENVLKEPNKSVSAPPKCYVSPNSFLNDSMAGRTTASSAAEVGRIRASTQVMRVSDMATVSPNSFLDSVGSKQFGPVAQTSNIPSPSTVLNDSIPHNIMMQQLDHVRKSLHDASFHQSPVVSSPVVSWGKPAPRPQTSGMTKDRLSQLAQPKMRNVFVHAQQHSGLAKKEKLLHRKIQERAQFSKIADAPSPRRKTFLVRKMQAVKKVSPGKGHLRSTKAGAAKKTGPRPVFGDPFVPGSSTRPVSTTEHTDTDNVIVHTNSVQCVDVVSRVNSQTVKKDQTQKENVVKPSNTVPTPHSQGEHRRGQWASPAVLAVLSPVLATRSDCDSTGEDLQADLTADANSRPPTSTQPASAPTETPVSTTDMPASPAKQVEDNKGRRSYGRRLFGDICVNNDLNLSKDFQPLWSGSATVAKDRPSISPTKCGSANTSKKLFPDISSSADTRCSLDSQRRETLAEKVEIVDMVVLTTQLPKKKNKSKVEVKKKSDSVSFAESSGADGQKKRADNKAEIVEMAAQQLSESRQRMFESLVDGQENRRENRSQVNSFTSFDWHSPQQLLQSPATEANRRSTLTVTKSRPSQALLNSCNTTADQCPDTPAPVTAPVADKQNASDEQWQTETIVIETRNNAVVSFSVKRGVLTPTELPTSPVSENSRRSTHAIRNPIVLNKDGLMPKKLFGTIPESKPLADSNESYTCETTFNQHRREESYITTQRDLEKSDNQEISSSGQRELVVKKNDSSLSYVCTDRLEKHLNYQRDVIVGSDSHSAVIVVANGRTNSQVLSPDSLDEEHSSSSQHNEEESFSGNTETPACLNSQDESGLDGKDVKQQLFQSQRLSLDHSQAESVSSHLTEKVKSTLLSEVNNSTENMPTEYIEAEKDQSESLTGVSCISSTTSANSSVFLEKECQKQPDVSEINVKLKETHAKPITSCRVVKNTFQKENASIRDKTASSTNTRKTDLTHQGQMRRSLSADLHDNVAESSKFAKPPVTFNFKDTAATSQKTKPASVTEVRGQNLPKTRSQGCLDQNRAVEQSQKANSSMASSRQNRKRSSPDAGLKNPCSKRVELEKRSTQPPAMRSQTTRRSTATKPVKPAKGVALSKLILVKKARTALPKHPLPFAAKNMYYDERWQDKQERGFVHWLNFVLTPAEEYMLATTKTKVDARSIAFDGTSHKVAPRLAPTKEILSFRAYAARRRLNHLRRASCKLFQSEEVVRVVCRLELEVEQRRLAVRTDRMIHADIGLKQKILDMLLSYNPLWLRIGLETVYGEMLPIQTNSDVIGMSRFILTRLLTSPDISAQYAHPTVPHLYHDGYADAVAQHTLKKFLVLVYFLDRAKQTRLIAHDPCLFCKDADTKSTKSLLIQFSRDFLSGEGDVTKHLSYMGYVVSHIQTPIDEFDYAVANLCTDLRDGIRLGRIVMLLSGDWTMTSSLRAPAISRLQKVHNVDLVFKQLAHRGLDFSAANGLELTPRNIVDGHREKTLAFLWKLIFHFQTFAMLSEQELQEEVCMLERTLRVKVCMQRLLSHPRNSECLARRDSGGVGVSMDNPMMQLLLKWCRTVCLHYGVKVHNFTVSFSDGRALCCLLHHYQPGLLPLTLINFRTSQSVQEAAEAAEDGAMGDDSELSQDWGAHPFGEDMDQSAFDSLLTNERENFKILYEKVSELGGIPLMLKASDMSNTIPDERVVVTYVSYLCARLLDLREETRAARIIQLAWRRLCLRRSARLRQRQIAASIVIQRAWRLRQVAMTVRRQQGAAVRIQAVWRGRQARLRASLLRQAKMNTAMHHAATLIQSCMRCYLARQQWLRQRQSAVTVQRWWIGQRAHTAFLRQRQACRVIQSHFRAHIQRSALRRQFVSLRSAAIVLQRAFRLKQQKRQERENRAACVLQSVWRARKCLQDFRHQKQAAVVIQSWWRANLAERQFIRVKSVVVIIQQWFRATTLAAAVRQEFVQQRHAALTLQKYTRGHQQRQQFCQLRRSALLIQKNFRRYKCSIKFQALRVATIIIQRAVRAHQKRTVDRQRFLLMRSSAIVIQRRFRQCRARQAAEREGAVLVIQACVRGHQARRQAQGLRAARRREAAAVSIQTFYRTAMARSRFHACLLDLRRNNAVVKIQAAWRGTAARRQAQLLRMAVRRQRASIVIQCAYRRHRAVIQRLVLQQTVREHKAATKIQEFYRRHTDRARLKAALLTITQARRERAALAIQCLYRRHLALKQLKSLQSQARQQSAAITIQAAVRRFLAQRRLRSLLMAARRERAAVKIQSAYRRHVAVLEVKRLRLEAKRQHAAVTLQCMYRSYQAVRQLKVLQLEARRERSALTIQTAYRAHLARSYVQALIERALQEASAIKIQAFFRGLHQRRRYLSLQRSVLLLQTFARGHSARKACREMKEALVMLADYHSTQEKFQSVLFEFHQRWRAALTLQAAWRGRQQRGQFIHMRSCVCKLQALVRGRAQRKQYLLFRKSALIIQRRLRAHREGQAVRLSFQLMLGAAVVIQSCWKSYVIRSYYLQLRASVICAQAHCRRFLQRRQFVRQREAAVCLQRQYRAWRLRQTAVREFQQTRRAILTMQALVRAKQHRHRFISQRNACVKIQSTVRAWLARKHFLRQRRSAILIQSVVKGHFARKTYQTQRDSVVRIQSAVRGWLARKQYESERKSVITVQSVARRWLAQRQYERQRRSVIVIQQRWRARATGRQAVTQYRRTRDAILTIQAHLRGHLTRTLLTGQHRAACMIQRYYRGYRARRQFVRVKQATVVLQQHVRAFLLGKQQHSRYVDTQKACVLIQSAYRGYITRQHYLRLRESVIKMQALVKGTQQRQRFLTLRRNVIRMQALVRCRQQHYSYLRLRRCVITVQAQVRAHQHMYRYLMLQRAALVCQNRYRAKCWGRVFRTAFLLIRAAAITIQKHTRGHQARLEYQRQRSAAITLQAHVRGWLQRRRLEERSRAALCVQQWWREVKAGKAVRHTFLHTRHSAVSIQRWWRALQQKRTETRHRAATVIQSHWRRLVAQRRFTEDKRKIVRLQTRVRGFLARRSFLQKRQAVRLIQKRWQETVIARCCRHDYLLKLGATVVIQSVFRGYRTRVYFSLAVRRVVRLQAAFRGCVQRRKYLALQQTVLSLQRRVRNNAACRRDRHAFLQQRTSAVCIQRAFRGWKRREEDMKVKAATCLQSYTRMFLARTRFLHTKAAVIRLQSAVRGHRARCALHTKKDAILFIQKRVRFFLTVQCLRRQVERRHKAASIIQRAMRRHLAHRKTQRREAAVKIQAAFRGLTQRRRFREQQRAALTLQCAVRGRRRAKDRRRKVKAAVSIQRWFRACLHARLEQQRLSQRAHYLRQFARVSERHLAVLRIQRWYRQALVMRQAQKQVHHLVVIQRRVRAFLQRVRYLHARKEAQELRVRRERAACVLQSAVRNWLERQRERQRIHLITKVQAIWRGRMLRRGLKSKKIALARQRVQAANEKATEEKSLRNRTASALDFLLHYKQLAYILDALMHLEVATRLSWECCERLVEVNAVNVIIRLILSCNRSLPHMELIKFSVSVLLNLAKYEKTTGAVYEAEESVSTLVDLMSVYREKGGAIFTKTCMLLALLASHPQRKTEMCADKRMVEKLQSIHALVVRKHRMQAARARVIARTSLNATLPSRFHAPQAGKVRPAWVLRRDSLHDIEDPMAALSFLLNTLHIGPK